MSLKKIKHKVLKIIFDGYGFDPVKEENILKTVWKELPDVIKQKFIEGLNKAFGKEIDIERNKENLFLQIFSKTFITTPQYPSLKKLDYHLDKHRALNFKKVLNEFNYKRKNYTEFIDDLIGEISKKENYVIWTVNTPFIFSLRNEFPSIVTKTTGKEIGYEDLSPEVQGSSETGHQQLGNLIVGLQPPFEVTAGIEDGSFFENPVLQECLNGVKGYERNLNLTFLLSGEKGDDGRVHSCWNHLEAFFKMFFENYGISPDKLRMQVILDGRDSPPYSSIKNENGKYNFMNKLITLLSQYNATESITWIIGRGIGMDRDYDEIKGKADYELMVKGKGTIVKDVSEALKEIENLHKNGYMDSNIPPIIIRDKNGSIRKIETNDYFLDLNFRADRQRAKIASLLGAKEFLVRESSIKGRQWKVDWTKDDLKLQVYTLTEYHPDFENKYGVKILFPSKPFEHNYLSILAKASEELNFKFNYLLLAESTKALHVGFFIRGKREKIEIPEHETRIIIPSYGVELDIKNDDDYFKTPQMKAYSIMGTLLNELYREDFELVIVNFSNCDMLGHLIVNHFTACVKAVEVMEEISKIIIPFALKMGYYIILTSDHGCIDDSSPGHGLNDILTTFISPDDDIDLTVDYKEKAKLFDIPWCVLEIMGVKELIKPFIPDIPMTLKTRGLIGKSLISLKRY
ncbi:MAG: hypothetical protein AB1422_15170 [bacterium]